MSPSSAIVAQGYAYQRIRGRITGYAMGSPDGFREEPWREGVLTYHVGRNTERDLTRHAARRGLLAADVIVVVDAAEAPPLR